MKQVTILIILIITLNTYAQTKVKMVDYPLQVGDIYFDSTVDDPDFKLCDESRVQQYFSFGKGLLFKGEKPKINEHFHEGLKNKKYKNESGFLTIRFIINCKGKTGRYRVKAMDSEYNEIKLSDELTDAILNLTKQLNGWTIGEREGKIYDYYQYLTFKIENGILTDIMP